MTTMVQNEKKLYQDPIDIKKYVYDECIVNNNILYFDDEEKAFIVRDKLDDELIYKYYEEQYEYGNIMCIKKFEEFDKPNFKFPICKNTFMIKEIKDIEIIPDDCDNILVDNFKNHIYLNDFSNMKLNNNIVLLNLQHDGIIYLGNESDCESRKVELDDMTIVKRIIEKMPNLKVICICGYYCQFNLEDILEQINYTNIHVKIIY